MSRLHRRPPFTRRIKQTLNLSLLPAPDLIPPALRLGQILLLFNLQRLLRQRLHDFESQKPENVDDIVIGFRIRHDPETGPFLEALAFAEGE